MSKNILKEKRDSFTHKNLKEIVIPYCDKKYLHCKIDIMGKIKMIKYKRNKKFKTSRRMISDCKKMKTNDAI